MFNTLLYGLLLDSDLLKGGNFKYDHETKLGYPAVALYIVENIFSQFLEC